MIKSEPLSILCLESGLFVELNRYNFSSLTTTKALDTSIFDTAN